MASHHRHHHRRQMDPMDKFNHYAKTKLKIDLVASSKLGKGAFGMVYGGRFNGQNVAIKIELDSNCKSLSQEADIYKQLQDPSGNGDVATYSGLPSCLFYSSERGQRIMVLPMMGRNLEKLREGTRRTKTFSSYTTMIIAYQILAHLKFIHSKGIVHKDIKPENMVVMSDEGLGRSMISLLDFGMGKTYLDRDGKVAADKHQKIIEGTVRFMGVGTHRASASSRRDDLQSLAYSLLFFLLGKLPWQGLHGSGRMRRGERHSRGRENRHRSESKMAEMDLGEDGLDGHRNKPLISPCKKCNRDTAASQREECRRSLILSAKRETPIDELCKDIRPIFKQFLKYSMTLTFDEVPNYDHWRVRFFDEACALSSKNNATDDRHLRYDQLDWLSPIKNK